MKIVGKNKKWLQIIILSIVVIIGGLTIYNNLFSDHQIPVVGDKAPNFKLLGLDGNVHQLSDYKGKVVIVNFWGTYCKYCKLEMPAIQKQYEQWKDSNVVVLGVNMGESQITAKAYVDQVKVTFPILLDENFEIRKTYGVIQYPTTFFVNPQGKIAKINVAGMDENYLQQAISSVLGK
ncbi:MAG: thiol-disulfide oxidoreductase [Bacilli bacterium]|nr:thiol-disulfide oxidoreductase [Bacilli bacterium]